MANNDAVQVDSQQEISVEDIFQFAKEFYKQIVILGFAGAMLAFLVAVAYGSYTATITLNNYNGLDILRIRYLQSALPKLEQENQQNKKNEADSFLSSEVLWTQSIKPNILVSKADGKELLDSTTLNVAGSKISSIQIIGKAATKEAAEQRVEKISKFFVDGSTYIDLRDLIRAYELKVISIDSNLKKKINSAQVELDYLQKRIKNLNELRGQYPATTTSLGQVLDAKDSGAKYLPITTQIVAATTDANNLKESLARYNDEESQNFVYSLFLKKAKPLIDKNDDGIDLGVELLDIVGKIDKDVSSNIQLIAVEDIKVALSTIQTNRVYGLKQAGVIGIENPPYSKYIGLGLFGGLFAGLLWVFAVKISRQVRGSTK